MERKKMKKKGFTLVELLVVIAIIAMLLAILMPALAKVRTLAQRIMCGTNVGGIGKAMLAYSSDDKYESFPVAGAGTVIWDYGATEKEGVCSWEWNKKAAPGSTDNPGTDPQESTISACLYLLVKYGDVGPDQFTCPGGEEKKFNMSDYTVDDTGTNPVQSFTDVWDFGDLADIKTGKARLRGHNSYSYQLPFPLLSTGTAYPIVATSNPAAAVLADRSPWWDYNARNPEEKLYTFRTDDCMVEPDTIPRGNSRNHQKDGQNVLFVDQHVRFEKSANCGVEQDNIYTTWNVAGASLSTEACGAEGRAKTMQCSGTEPPGQNDTAGNYTQDALDSYLVQDYN